MDDNVGGDNDISWTSSQSENKQIAQYSLRALRLGGRALCLFFYVDMEDCTYIDRRG